MNTNLIKVRFVAAFLFLVYTAVVKYQHAEAADTLLTVALVFTAACLAFVLYEVMASHRIGRNKKALWVAGCLLLSWPVMLYYVFAARKSVRNQREDDLHTSSL
jgi:uncharacterized membrane protein